LPAIYRAAVAKSGDSVVPDTPHAQVLLPVPGRSSECGPEQARSYRGDGRFRIVPTLCVGMPVRTLRVHFDAERQSLRYHAERGNDQERERRMHASRMR
jgi:hypothetical protein